MSASIVLAALVPVFMLIVMGVITRRAIVTDDVHWIGVERLIYYVLFPALLINTLSLVDLTRVPLEVVGGALFTSMILMTLVCLALRRPLATWFGTDGPAFTSVFQGATRWQTFIGLAVASNLYGEYGLALASVAAATIIPIANVTSVWVLTQYATPTKPRWVDVAWAIAKNPFIWSCVIGIALNVAHVPIPLPVRVFADALGRAALALGLLLVGAGLHLRGLVRPEPAALIATALKLVLMPAMAITLARLFGGSGAPVAVVACCAAVPTASNAYVLARQMGGDTKLLAEILMLQTIVAGITMPLAIELALR